MTTKEKAEELFEKMLNTDGMDMTRFCSKQCALIAVGEILKELESIDDGQTVIPYNYWQQVKTEIKKL
jgi:endogenous inhibitor of DNA gyrase (YacG/DUF329 family)